MNILLTNDDGFWAPGISALYDALVPFASVTIIAPREEQSGKGHGITMDHPLRLNEESIGGKFIGYSLNGTPADCVKIALRNLFQTPPDLVISGINLGRNTGINVLYSGTVAAALEGALYGIPSVAFSLDTKAEQQPLAPIAEMAVKFARLVPKLGLPKGVMLNVNFPSAPPEHIAGFMVTRQGGFRFRDVFEERKDPRGNRYYWLRGDRIELEEAGKVDEGAVRDRFVSITPLHFDLTAHEWLEHLEGIDFGAALEKE